MSLSMESKVKILSIQEGMKTNAKTGKPYQIGSGFCQELNSDVIIKRTLVTDDGEVKSPLTEAHIGREFTGYITTNEDKTALFAEISLKNVIDANTIKAFMAKAKETVAPPPGA